ncbi:MAG: gas vesicle protein GvpD P-loop domain-containing protein [Candidatus Thermoplasmatota archaeon]
MKKERCIPNEIISFFKKPGGRSLLVKGGAGTGKTTFALEVLDEIAGPEDSFYLSTRVSDESLYIQFPWLKDKEYHTRILDAGRLFLESLYKKEISVEAIEKVKEDKRVKGAREFLKSIKKTDVPREVNRTNLDMLLGKCEMPEIERVYDKIEEKLPKKTLFVIDSLEGVTTKYKVKEDELVTTLQKDLVENSNTDMLMVLEKDTDTTVDFLVDGVVMVSKREIEGRRVREIKIEKLRATEIMQPSYLTTLAGGRFLSFEPFTPKLKGMKWESIPDTEHYYSTGVPDIDKLLGGGYKKGSYNVIEVGENVSSEEYYAVIRPILLNFISHERGCIIVLPGGEHADALREDLVRYIEPEVFDKYIHVADYFLQESTKPYIMALGTRNKEEALRNWKNVLHQLRGATQRPIMDFASFDTLEYLRGNEITIRDLFNTVGATKISKDIGIGILKPGLKLSQEIMNMADTYLKIMDIDKSCCICGVKPHTIIYVITPDKEKGLPYISLTPVV